jgi:hypothetical protein
VEGETKNRLRSSTVQPAGVEPVLVLEKPAERKSDLPMLIPLAAGRARPGITQDVTPVLDQLYDAIRRAFWYR